MSNKKRATNKEPCIMSNAKSTIDFTDKKLIETVLAGFKTLDQDIRSGKVKISE